jgi:hypothetical protein
MADPTNPQDLPSLKSLEEAIANLERQYAQPVDETLAGRQRATLMFLGAMRELVEAFCRQGSKEEEPGYIPFALPEA